MTSVRKSPEIYVDINYFANRGHTFLFLICLAKNFKAIA